MFLYNTAVDEQKETVRLRKVSLVNTCNQPPKPAAKRVFNTGPCKHTHVHGQQGYSRDKQVL